MTPIDGLSLEEAENAIEEAHPGFELWHTRNESDGPPGIYATLRGEATYAEMGLPLYAPSIEAMEPVIGEWEYEHHWGSAA